MTNTYYHYTSKNAISGILRKNSPNGQEICLWVTRYDCFEDTEEYSGGIKLLHDYLVNYEAKHSIPNQNRLSYYFKEESIAGNINIPSPYIASLSKRPDNDYMWKKYADNNNGVVLALDANELKKISLDQSMLWFLKDCKYLKYTTQQEWMKLLESEISVVEANVKQSLFLHHVSPNVIARFDSRPLKAMLLLANFAAVVKRSDYVNEEETRIIVTAAQQEFKERIENYIRNNSIKNPFNPYWFDEILYCTQRENTRLGKNGQQIRYREVYFPKSALKKIIVKKNPEKVYEHIKNSIWETVEIEVQ